jgi:hypothetical protein
MFDHNLSWFPFWSYRNGGEPILASPEHFYFLGYIIDWGSEYSNVLLNICLFSSILMIGSSAYILGRYVSRSNILAAVYAIGITCNGIIIEAERSARFQQITIITLTLVCSYLFLSKNKNRHWLIPICITVSIYNGIHYGIYPVAALFMFALFPYQKEKVVEVIKSTVTGVILSLPFLLPVVFHPVTSGIFSPDQLNYQISTIELHDLTGMFTKDELYHFVGYQTIFVIPLILLSVLKPYRNNIQLLLPIVPWLYFIIAAYSENFKYWFETTPLSNWRWSIIFYENFMIFSMLFVISMISSLKNHRKLVVIGLVTATTASYVSTFSDARAEFIEATKKTALHVTNEISLWQKIFEESVNTTANANRVLLSSGLLIPEHRTFTTFSMFMSEGYWNVRSASTPNVELAQRPHWVGNGNRGSCNDYAPILSYAGYRYLICFPHITNVGYGYEKINTDKWGVFENPSVSTVGLACNPDETISQEITQACKQNLNGHAEYSGDTIQASISLDDKSTIFFHENYAWGWYGWINNKIHLPRKVNNVFIGFDLEPGKYDISLRYIDPFFILGITTIFAYFLFYFLLHKFKNTKKRKRIYVAVKEDNSTKQY